MKFLSRSKKGRLAGSARSSCIFWPIGERSTPDIPQAEAFARQLKAQGYRFVGPTSVYAFMQNVGVVNDHIHGCFRAID